LDSELLLALALDSFLWPGCPLSLNPAQLAAFMKIPEKDRYIMVNNLSFENDRERRSLRLLNDR
jgi:hypothetical protein